MANEEYDQYEAEDVWQLGLILCQLLTGETIVKDMNNQLKQENIDQEIEFNGQQIDQNIKNLLKQMLVIKSQNRIKFDVLFEQLRQLQSNQMNFNFQNLQYSKFNIKLLIDIQSTLKFTQQHLENLDMQFQIEFQMVFKKKQTSIKKAMIDILQENISQNLFLIQEFNSNKQELYIDQNFDNQSNNNNLEQWQRTDELFLQIQQQFQMYIQDLKLYQKNQTEQLCLQKEKQIRREITWQIKQQLLLEQKIYIQYQEYRNQGNTEFNIFLEKIIRNSKNKLIMLREYLDNSVIIIQKQSKYNEFKTLLREIEQGINQEDVENILKLQKQLMDITNVIDSFEKEVELEQLGNKLQRDNITIINKSQNLLREFSTKVDDEILILGKLKYRNYLLMKQNQEDHYFDHKIKALNILKQHLIEERQQFSQGFPNQQIESMLLQIQDIKFFNEKISKFISQQELEVKQFQAKLQRLTPFNMQNEITDLINQFIDQMELMETYFQVSEICCKDINSLIKQQENKKELLQILERQSQFLSECQIKLQQSNLITESNIERFDSKNFFKQSFQKVYQFTIENFASKLQEIIILKEEVRSRIRFYVDEDFFKRIIISLNNIKAEMEKLQNMLQEIKERIIKNYTNKEILQEQMNKINGLIIQIKLQHKIKPSFEQIQMFNKEYLQNEISYLELFTLVVYIQQYHNSIVQNVYLSLKSNNLEKLSQKSQDLSQPVIKKQQGLQKQIQECRQKQSEVQIMMGEYLSCLQKKTEVFKIAKLCNDYNTLTKSNQTLENEIIQIIKVKLNGYQKDKQLINEIIRKYNILQISALFCYSLAIE